MSVTRVQNICYKSVQELRNLRRILIDQQPKKSKLTISNDSIYIFLRKKNNCSKKGQLTQFKMHLDQ